MSQDSEADTATNEYAATRQRSFGCMSWLVGLGILLLLVALLLPTQRRAREPARREQCQNNLRMIALALQNYADVHGVFPPAFTVDADGRPLHSWRTLLLPYVDQAPLYREIDLTKPWDDPVNAKACSEPLSIYSCPSGNGPRHHTTYLANAASNGCLRPAAGRSISDITDGTSNTLLVVEVPADRSVPWASPQDADELLILRIRPDSVLVHAGGFQAAMCDGSVRFLSAEMSTVMRLALISIAAGDKVDDF
jgi:prepilin-type processing-associated H-X9-DG protein